MWDHFELTLEKDLKVEKDLEKIISLHLQMTLNVNVTALQRVEILKIRTEIPTGKGQSCHRETNVVDVSVKHVAIMYITHMIIADLKILNPLMIAPRDEDVAVMTAVLIRERAKEKAKAKALIETIANSSILAEPSKNPINPL
jgi:hypothetical protein